MTATPTAPQLAFLRELAAAGQPVAAMHSASRRPTRSACWAAGWVERDYMPEIPACRYWLTAKGRAVLQAAEPPADIDPRRVLANEVMA